MLAGGIAVAAVATAPANPAACTEFESAYNQMAEAVTLINSGEGYDDEAARSVVRTTPERLAAAAESASGAVQAAMTASADAASTYFANPSSSGRDFFVAAISAQQACEAAGSSIDLEQLSS